MKITGYAQSRTILCKVGDEKLRRDLERLSDRNNWQLVWIGVDTDLLAIPKFATIIDRNTLPEKTWRSYLSFVTERINEGIHDNGLHLFLDDKGSESILESKVVCETGEKQTKRIEYELRIAHRKNVNKRLREYYESALPEIQANLISYKGVSGPLFLSVTDEYEQSRTKVLLIGQQTNEWGALTNSLEEILECYKKFEMGKHHPDSPFWRAACQLNNDINPNGPERAFLWSNLVKVDQNGKRATRVVEELIGKANLLQEEIKILQPQVVIFLTGPDYDQRLEATFPGLKYSNLSRWTRKLESNSLPSNSYRTYHPSWLLKSRNWDELKIIVNDIRTV